MIRYLNAPILVHNSHWNSCNRNANQISLNRTADSSLTQKLIQGRSGYDHQSILTFSYFLEWLIYFHFVEGSATLLSLLCLCHPVTLHLHALYFYGWVRLAWITGTPYFFFLLRAKFLFYYLFVVSIPQQKCGSQRITFRTGISFNHWAPRDQV